MITRRFALLLLFALSLQVLAPEPAAALGGVAVGAPLSPSDLEIRPAAVVVSTKDPQALSFSVRHCLLRRKERQVRHSVRREWGIPARLDVTEHGELPRLAGLASGSRFPITVYTLGRIRDDDRGPPVS